MAKKRAAKKTAKKVTKKPARASGAASAGGKPTTPKTAKKTAKKTTKKATTKPAPKKVTKKKVAPKATAKKTAKKVLKKKTTKAATKLAKKAAAKQSTPKASAAKKATITKSTTKKTATKKPVAKKTPAKKAPAKKSPAPKKKASDAPAEATTKPAEAVTDAGADDKASGRKGITIVKSTNKKPGGRSRSTPKFVMPDRPQLLGPGSAFGNTPLIPSGPSAPKVTSIFDEPKSKRTKSPLSKAKLDNYRLLLIAKRAELLGDMTSMENEALRSGGSGSLSRTPQHIAEQGSESYDQTLSLNLAAQDRRLIKDIDEALKRIDLGTYGLCELTGHPIPEPRLNELPWARYTIEAARELERRGNPT